MQLNFIANASQPSSSGRTIPMVDPSDGGYGREKGFEALHGFTTPKTVAIRHG